MHVLDPADVRALVNIETGLQRTGEDVADQVQLVPLGAHVNRLVGVGEGQIEDLAQLSVGADGPRVGRDIRSVCSG